MTTGIRIVTPEATVVLTLEQDEQSSTATLRGSGIHFVAADMDPLRAIEKALSHLKNISSIPNVPNPRPLAALAVGRALIPHYLARGRFHA